MADLIRFRRGTAAEWTAANPVLATGEPGFETDTGRTKIGADGSTWAELPYFLAADRLSDRAAVVNVQDAAYGAQGNGTHDDTAAIQAAIDATAAGGTTYLPPGRYLVGASSDTPAVLTGADNITISGSGQGLSVVVLDPGSTATKVLSLSGQHNVTVRDLGFEGSSKVASGVHAATQGTQKNLAVLRCGFHAFMPGNATSTLAAVYTYTSDGVTISDCEFVGCGRAITIDQPDGVANVIRNRITSETRGVMATGVLVRRSSSVSQTKVVVSGNYVTGATYDPSGVGAEGHGIAAYRCRDVHVTNNHCYASGRGILVSFQSYGAIVQGNTCVANSDAGIRCEPEISDRDITVGADVPRGVVVIGNVCRDNASIGAVAGANTGSGICLSYAAGSTVSSNLCHDNTGDGIVCDSDRVTIIGNVAFNNFGGYTEDPTNGHRAGIRVYAGSGCTIIGNQAFDNQATPTQMFGLSLSAPGGAHVVSSNRFAGNGVGEVSGLDRIVDGAYGVSPVPRPVAPAPATGTDADTINGVITALKALGLLS